MTIPRRPHPPEPDPVREVRRKPRYHWAFAGLLFGLVMFAAFLGLAAHEFGRPVPTAGVLFLAVLCAAAGAGFGFTMWFMGRKAVPPPPGSTFATRREAARVIRTRRPTGDPRVDALARTIAKGVVDSSPWSTVYLPLVVFVVGFGIEISAVTIHVSRSEWGSPGPWINLFGAVLFFVMLVVVLPSVLRTRENAHAFLREPDRAARPRTPGADR